MHFTVINLAPVPDIAAARRLQPFDGLDAVSVAKALAHQRKQATGNELLRWDQCTIGAACTLRHTQHGIQVDTWVSDTRTDAPLLLGLGKALDEVGQLLTWDPDGYGLAVLRYRCLVHGIALPAAWSDDVRMDRALSVGTGAVSTPSLNGLAVQLGLPVDDTRDHDDAVEAWLKDDPVTLCDCVVFDALQTYLLALRLLHARGVVSRREHDEGVMRLRGWLDERQGTVSTAFATQLAGSA